MKTNVMKNGGNGMLSQQKILDVLSTKLNIWKEKYGVKKIGLFGSYNSEDQKESSDIDILVEFNNANLSFDNYMELKISLEDLFNKPVDLVIVDDIKTALKASISDSAKFAEEI